jgi:hypothetical protein
MSKNLTRLTVFETIKNAWEKTHGSKRMFWYFIALTVVAFYIVAFAGLLLVIIGMSMGKLLLHNADTGLNTALFLLTGLKFVMAFIITQVLMYVGIQHVKNLPLMSEEQYVNNLLARPEMQRIKNSFIQWLVKKNAKRAIWFSMIKDILKWNIFFKMIGGMLFPSAVFLLLNLLLSIFNSLAAASYSEPIKLFCDLLSFLSIILTIYLLFRMYLVHAFILAKKVNPWVAIKLSFKATKSNVCRLIGLSILNGLILLVSAIPLGIGLIWTLPYFFINFGEIYKSLVESRSDLTIENNA